ncbi:hypothetical protein GCM10009682_27100 [Luedemannella flava]|uniref:Transposase n=1 Tax=Luedemannella flava TaxID=349316 RepID=A0ABP4Y7E8_9ACTN
MSRPLDAVPSDGYRRLTGWLGRLAETVVALRRRTHTAPDEARKRRAIARAIAVMPPARYGLRTWLSADATFFRGLWLCVLEEEQTIHIVAVSPQTSRAYLAAQSRPARDDWFRRPPRYGGAGVFHAYRCSQEDGIPPSRGGSERGRDPVG